MHSNTTTESRTRALFGTVAGSALLALVGCGASAPNGVDPGANLPPGAVADCPIPETPNSPPVDGISSTSTTGGGTGQVGNPITPTQTPSPMETIPGYAMSMPPAAPVETGDATATAGLDRSIALHVGRTVRLTFSPFDAVVVPSTPDPSVLRLDGRSCEPDGTAVFAFIALMPGTVVFTLDVGPRCLHARPPCAAGEQAVPLRVDVVN